MASVGCGEQQNYSVSTVSFNCVIKCTRCDIESQCCRVLAVVVSCAWIHFLVDWWGEAVLCLRAALPWITPFLLWEQSLLCECVCVHAYFCSIPPPHTPLPFSYSPMTSLKLLSANILILPSLQPFLSLLFHLTFCVSPDHAPVFSFIHPLSLSLPPFFPFSPLCGSLALQEFLPSSSPLINSLLSQSLLFLFFTLTSPLFPSSFL